MVFWQMPGKLASTPSGSGHERIPHSPQMGQTTDGPDELASEGRWRVKRRESSVEHARTEANEVMLDIDLSGKTPLTIAGATDACFIQVLPAKAGERYYASVWARSEGPPSGHVRLVIGWQEATGGWVWSQPRREASIPAGHVEWRQLALVFTVPEGVGRAVILLAGRDFEAETAARFDDMRLVRLPEL